MPPTSNIYKNEEPAPRPNQVLAVNSEFALKAFSMFPKEEDINILLEKDTFDAEE